MQQSSFLVKASLLATLIASGQALALNLPDEINHPHYLKIYQNLETVLNGKIAEFNKLSAEKAQLEKTIAEYENSQSEIPRRNDELQNIIAGKQQELSRLTSEIQGLEGVLSKIMEDLNRLDAMIAQLQQDVTGEASRSQQLANQRHALAQDLARLNARLQKEIREENQSVQVLNALNTEMQVAAQNIAERDQDRRNLIIENDRNRKVVVTERAELNKLNKSLPAKKNELSSASAKLPGIQADIKANEAKLPTIDGKLNPAKKKLGELKAELDSRQPEVTKLEKENTELEAKIKANKSKIQATGLPALIDKREALEKEISKLEKSIETLGDSIVALKERMKQDILREMELKKEMREAQRTMNLNLLRRLSAENDLLQKRLAPQRQELAKLEKQHEAAALALAPKKMELKTVTDKIPGLETQVAGLQKEIDAAKAKIKANDAVIAAQSAANAGLIKEIAEVTAQVNALQNERETVKNKIAALKKQEDAIEAQVKQVTAEIAKIEKEIKTTADNIAALDKEIAGFPMALKRLEMNIQKLNEVIAQKRAEANREERLLQRIRQDRIAIERDVLAVQNTVAQIDQDIDQSQRLLQNLRGKLQEEQQNRVVLTRYNQDSISKFDALKQQKASAEAEIDGATKELAINDQDLATIQRELPKLRLDLGRLNPRVSAAEGSMNDAQNRAYEANTQYQSRLNLYGQHLSAAQSLGVERAGIASTDGDKAGRIDAKTQAIKMATENAASQGKWEALLRGYVHGELGGYDSGFQIGMSSEQDAAQGTREGQAAGALRARNHADHVLKPEFYLEEMDRRLRDEEVTFKKLKIQGQALSKSKLETSSSAAVAARRSEVPELTAQELSDSRGIVTALDAMIEQAGLEIREILNRRKSLSEAKNAYAVLSTGANAQNPNCSGVYKNVKDFVEACKSAYSARYELLFGSAHYNSFVGEYADTFKAQVESTFSSELARLYPTYLKEASAVGKQVGVAQGQKEIFRQNFERAEKATYASNLPIEEQRVAQESVDLVNSHLSQNGALTLKGSARLGSGSAFGISPGAELDLVMTMKNVGEVASLGDSVVKITQASQNLILSRREAPVASVAGKTASSVNVMKLTVSENAVPGSRVFIAGQIIHPGNHYRANRVEDFRIETVLGVNPSLTASFDYDTTPKVAGIFGGIKEHEIEMTLSPKFAGVENYEVSLEEVGSNFVTVLTKPVQTGALKKGSKKEISLEYKMSKAARDKSLKLRVTVKHESRVVEAYDIQIKPH